MAQDLEPWRTPAATLSLEQRSSISRTVLSSSTTPNEAAKAAARLVGTFANLKPQDADTFVGSIAAVLSEYPLGLVQECIDPRRGAARKIKFLSVAELVEWLDERLAFHQALAGHVARPPAPPPKVYSPEHRATMLERFGALMRGMLANRVDPIERFRREHAALSESGKAGA